LEVMYFFFLSGQFYRIPSMIYCMGINALFLEIRS
jgi:hypothetical protein